jgi:hypothetical protein
MRRILRPGKRALAIGLAALAAAAAATAIAAAAIPDSNKTFTACMLKDVGTIRLIDPSLPQRNLMSHCSKLEQEVTWDGQGQPGATGPQGPKGDIGPTGPQGQKGDIGPTGPQGPAGQDGAKGATGPQGPAGADGKDGATGPQGAKGATGPQGPAGQDGTDGKDGVSVTSQRLNAGDDSACPAGGSKFSVAGGNVTYACNGSDGSGQIVGGHGQNLRNPNPSQQQPTTLGHIPGFGDIKLWFNGSGCRIEFANTSSDTWTGFSGGSSSLTFAPGQSRNAVSTFQDPISVAFFTIGDADSPQGGELTVHYFINTLDNNTCTGGFDGELG